VEGGADAGLAYGPGKFAAGYFYAAQAVWAGGLGETIEREIADGCRSITIAGYSLGAAVAQLLAIRIEVRPELSHTAGEVVCTRIC
jgi:hypothetical protein